MKKKLGVIITLLTLCICLMTPQMHAKAASGKTTIAVSASSLNIGQTVTVTAKALSASGDSAYANMVLTYDAGILEFVSCNATYGGGGGSISVASDSFSVTLKAISAGKASISLSATDGVIYGTEEELDSMAGSSTSVTVKNEAAGSNGNEGNGSSSGTGSNNNTGSNTAALSADNSLKALTISPGTLSPAFKGSTTKYTATVDNSVTSIAVSATPVNEKATIESVTGNTNLAVGANVVQIVVKAENGTTATYKITVTRQADKKLKKFEGNIEFKDVSFAYENNLPVLKNMNFKINANETIGFVGPSGSGKTTIFNLISAIERVNKGSITFDGVDINSLDKSSIRGNLSVISQNAYIFNMSIMDNLKVIKKNATVKEIKEACHLACLDDFIESLPNKYDTIVGEGGVTLSGGQKQRLAIARALLLKTEILLFDEATSALDNETQTKIQEAVSNLKGEYTILIIAHRLSTIIDADKILVINDGKVEATGSHKTLLKISKTYQKLYEKEISENKESKI